MTVNRIPRRGTDGLETRFSECNDFVFCKRRWQQHAPDFVPSRVADGWEMRLRCVSAARRALELDSCFVATSPQLLRNAHDAYKLSGAEILAAQRCFE